MLGAQEFGQKFRSIPNRAMSIKTTVDWAKVRRDLPPADTSNVRRRFDSPCVGTALVALVAGAVGAGITGLLQLRRDRVETLRQRQLDAADALAASASRVLLSVKLLVDSYPKEPAQANVERWREDAKRFRDSFSEDVRAVAALTPRIELLFGVESPASVAALQASFDLTQMASSLQPPIGAEAFSWGYKLAASSMLRFHHEAHLVVAGSLWRRLRHRPLPDEAFEEMRAELQAKYGITVGDAED